MSRYPNWIDIVRLTAHCPSSQMQTLCLTGFSSEVFFNEMVEILAEKKQKQPRHYLNFITSGLHVFPCGSDTDKNTISKAGSII